MKTFSLNWWTDCIWDLCSERETLSYPESLGFWARTSQESQMHKAELLSAVLSLSHLYHPHPPRVTSVSRRHFLGSSVEIWKDLLNTVKPKCTVIRLRTMYVDVLTFLIRGKRISAMVLKRSSWLLWSTSAAQRRAAILYARLSLRHSFNTTSSTSQTVGWPAKGFCSSALEGQELPQRTLKPLGGG